MNSLSHRGGPSDIWIVCGDDLVAGEPRRMNGDYPDPDDNHGRDRANVIFRDGHTEWMTRKNYLRSFYRGTDEFHLSTIP